MSGLNLILKITERCNLNCSYCYYFNGLDQSFRNNPPLMSLDILEEVIKFILQGIKELKIKRLAVILHGGEPLLMPKSQFSSICNKLYQSLAPELDEFSLRLQTNGVLINGHWIDIFSEYKIKIGISLDGPAQYHDEFRVDHRARGSHAKVIKAIELLQKKQLNFGILSVVNPSYNPVVIYNYFTKTLGITGFNFLLPDCTHDHLPPYPAEEYGKFITAIFDEWVKQDDDNIQILFLNSYLNVFLGGESLIYGIGLDNNIASRFHIAAIRSNGDLSPTDELISTAPKSTFFTGKSVFNTTLKEFFNIPIFKELNHAFINAPDLCKSCCWEKVCGGGSIVERFSSAKRFNNPSVYCQGLKLFFSRILQYLLSNGIPLASIEHRLNTFS